MDINLIVLRVFHDESFPLIQKKWIINYETCNRLISPFLRAWRKTLCEKEHDWYKMSHTSKAAKTRIPCGLNCTSIFASDEI